MKNYYVIEERYFIEDYIPACHIYEDVLFNSLDEAKEYLIRRLQEYKTRNGEWKLNDCSDSIYYEVEVYGSDDGYWEENIFYFTRLELI